MLLNGIPIDPDKLRILALNNFGHFTSMRVENNRVRGLALHLDRLTNDCRTIFGAELDTDYLRTLVKQAVSDIRGPIVVRVTIFDPDLDLGHPGNESKPQILISRRSAVDGPPPPMTLKTVRYERELPLVKHVGLFATMYHRRQAQLAGADDVLFVDRLGGVSEGATWNIGFVEGDEIIWPNSPCLPGTTMELIKQLHPSRATAIEGARIAEWSGAFITNAAIGIRPVAAIDGHHWPEIPTLVRLLSERYIATQGDLI